MTEGICNMFCILIFQVSSLIHIRINQNQINPESQKQTNWNITAVLLLAGSL